MNMEILSAEIKNNKTHIFSFTETVVQYMIGFSKFVINYPDRDHHVKEISINLTNIHQSNNEILVTPKLIMKDGSDNHETDQSMITVVVIATVGYGNPNIYLLNNVKPDINYDLPLQSISYIKSAISTTKVEIPGYDHHLCKYFSYTSLTSDYNTFMMKGDTFICDHGNNSGRGQILASAFICYSIDQRIFCADFSSETIGNSGTICLGEMPQNFNPNDYKFGIFVSEFHLSFGTEKDDHHVYKVEVSAEVCNGEVIQNEICAKINLKSFLTDNGKNGEVNKSYIPHNKVSGFVIAFNNKKY